ncbi:hypothetical protein EYF80_013921 [Liparis tanakae]|uniref:Uncharacterized protein n=1 Tax=Liparis tanakae TaxID=230148 RepID=A0A4Z2IEB2_9TELE|nr:hypothetical protein EYF80_013921 [Liparis tanakae]
MENNTRAIRLESAKRWTLGLRSLQATTLLLTRRPWSQRKLTELTAHFPNGRPSVSPLRLTLLSPPLSSRVEDIVDRLHTHAQAGRPAPQSTTTGPICRSHRRERDKGPATVCLEVRPVPVPMPRREDGFTEPGDEQRQPAAAERCCVTLGWRTSDLERISSSTTITLPFSSYSMVAQSNTFPLGAVCPWCQAWMALRGSTRSHMFTSVTSPTKLCTASRPPRSLSGSCPSSTALRLPSTQKAERPVLDSQVRHRLVRKVVSGGSWKETPSPLM